MTVATAPLTDFNKLISEFSALDENSRIGNGPEPVEVSIEDLATGDTKSIKTLQFGKRTFPLMPLKDYSEGYNKAGWGPAWIDPHKIEKTFAYSIDDLRGEIEERIKDLETIVKKLEWVDSHCKKGYSNVYREYKMLSTVSLFQITTWKARLMEILEGNDAALLAHMNLKEIHTTCYRYNDELDNITHAIKRDPFHWTYPVVYGFSKWYDARAKKNKAFRERVARRYKKFRDAVVCKVPFIIEVLKTPTEDIKHYRLNTIDRRREDSFEVKYDEIYKKFQALCK